MTDGELIRCRLLNQQIAGTKFKTPQQIVEWMVAMQAQEYAMAKWAIGLRLPGSIDDNIEKAFENGDILRTHLMRPTWHFELEKGRSHTKSLASAMDYWQRLAVEDRIDRETPRCSEEN